ncbi:MAG: DUF2071 domain-containing protein [Planctomycetes bacterium]|nr:DUF2071 domain-containing protein [Planctomycetota bacterium]
MTTQPLVTPGPLTSPAPPVSLSDAARNRIEFAEGGPVLLSDWTGAVFLHYRVDPDALRPHVPFELDTRDGWAYVSLVAFRFEQCRVCIADRVIRWAGAPFSGHAFLNLRTYVTERGEPGIYFLSEWLNNPLSVALGPRMFGLPYHWGTIHERHRPREGRLAADVRPVLGQGAFNYEAVFDPDGQRAPAAPGSLDEFVVERYSAYTMERSIRRRFRIWHRPWELTPAQAEVTDHSLLALHPTHRQWFAYAELTAAHYSPGVRDVWIGRPMCINGPACGVGWPVPNEPRT